LLFRMAFADTVLRMQWDHFRISTLPHSGIEAVISSSHSFVRIWTYAISSCHPFLSLHLWKRSGLIPFLLLSSGVLVMFPDLVIRSWVPESYAAAVPVVSADFIGGSLAALLRALGCQFLCLTLSYWVLSCQMATSSLV
jgi:hypothetical protein